MHRPAHRRRGLHRLVPPYLVPAVFLAIAACSDSTGPEAPSLTGQWSGTSQGITLTVTLSEDASGALSGSGTFSVTGGAIAVTITGSHAHPAVSFTLTANGIEDSNYSGTVTSPDRIDGSLSGSGFNAFQIPLVRQGGA